MGSNLCKCDALVCHRRKVQHLLRISSYRNGGLFNMEYIDAHEHIEIYFVREKRQRDMFYERTNFTSTFSTAQCLQKKSVVKQHCVLARQTAAFG